jgi:hypothetical protein
LAWLGSNLLYYHLNRYLLTIRFLRYSYHWSWEIKKYPDPFQKDISAYAADLANQGIAPGQAAGTCSLVQSIKSNGCHIKTGA